MDHKCSNCSNPLVIEVAHGVQIEACPACGGIWLGAEDLKTLVTGEPSVLEDLIKAVPESIDHKHMGGSRLLCPACDVLMEEYHYLYNSPILIHTCPDCHGIFVNADELPLMHQWFVKAHEGPSEGEKLRIAMANDIAEHEGFLYRQMHLKGLFNTLRRTGSGWSGFFI